MSTSVFKRDLCRMANIHFTVYLGLSTSSLPLHKAIPVKRNATVIVVVILPKVLHVQMKRTDTSGSSEKLRYVSLTIWSHVL